MPDVWLWVGFGAVPVSGFNMLSCAVLAEKYKCPIADLKSVQRTFIVTFEFNFMDWSAEERVERSMFINCGRKQADAFFELPLQVFSDGRR